MILIKRYANRKLYHTQEKRYVSLSDIRDRIREGADVMVIDNESGEDITSVTLSQIIYEQEKKREGLLPPSVLKDLVKAGSGTVFDSVRKIVDTGLGAARTGREEVEKGIRRFLRSGEISGPEADRLREELGEVAEESHERGEIERRIEQVLGRLQIVRKSEIEKLREMVAELEQKVDELLESRIPS